MDVFSEVNGGITVGVVDYDSRSDLMVGGTLGSSSSTKPRCGNVLVGYGQGEFVVRSSQRSGTLLVGALGDFTGDGRPDLMSTTPSGNLSLVIYVQSGKGDGTFGAATYAFAGGVGIVAELNDDGKLDVAYSTQVWLGNGNGTFQNYLS